jgi:membrane peptidoglycan carboxypeptidase
VRALTAIEDQRFYDHRGYDVVRIASAALANLRHRRAVQGARRPSLNSSRGGRVS